jgi:HK97 family phage major capsid protein
MGTGGLGAYPGTTGGFLAPILFADAVESAKKLASDFFAFSTIIPTTTGTPLPYPNVDDTGVSGEQVAENSSMKTNAADVPGEGDQVVFYSYKYSAKSPAISIELAQDAYNDFDSWLIETFATRIARAASTKFLLGLGPNNTTGSPPVPAPEPMGLLTAAAWSGLAVIGDGNAVSPNPRGQVGVSDLINLQLTVDALYRRKGVG